MDASSMQELMPLIDRIVAPITEAIRSLEQRQREDVQALHSKLDSFNRIGEIIAAAEQRSEHHDERLAAVEGDAKSMAAELATVKGRNQVIGWVLTIVGGPAVAALGVAGIAKILGWGG